jgi:hypothetical protein
MKNEIPSSRFSISTYIDLKKMIKIYTIVINTQIVSIAKMI